MDDLATPIMRFVYLVITVFGVAHLNDINIKKTPILDAATWWLMTLGAFSIWWLDINDVGSDWGFAVFGLGAAGLVTIITQPEWRPFIANRRRTPEPKLPPDCDRRCELIRKMRKPDGPPHATT